jgi:hypothetical protein
LTEIYLRFARAHTHTHDAEQVPHHAAGVRSLQLEPESASARWSAIVQGQAAQARQAAEDAPGNAGGCVGACVVRSAFLSLSLSLSLSLLRVHVGPGHGFHDVQRITRPRTHVCVPGTLRLIWLAPSSEGSHCERCSRSGRLPRRARPRPSLDGSSSGRGERVDVALASDGADLVRAPESRLLLVSQGHWFDTAWCSTIHVCRSRPSACAAVLGSQPVQVSSAIKAPFPSFGRLHGLGSCEVSRCPSRSTIHANP